MSKKRISNTIQLTDWQKKKLEEEIKAFYLDVRDEEIGIIEQQQILELFCEHLAPIIYNKALDDAQYWYKQQQDNMEADFFSLYRDV